MKIKPFNVVTGFYTKVDGTTDVGLFVVVYTENSDSEIYYDKNYVGLKITSKPLFLDKYSYALDPARNTYLEKKSWVQCNRPHVLDLNKVKIIGIIDLGTRMALYRKFKEFLYESEGQMLDNIPVKGVK